MATGIVSTGLSLDGQETLSKITLGIAAVIWVALAILLPLRAARDPAGFRADVRSPGASQRAWPLLCSAPGWCCSGGLGQELWRC